MSVTKEQIYKLVVKEASLSLANKRKVGAILAYPIGNEYWIIASEGHNYNPEGPSCEDSNGNTFDTVVHAEVACIEQLKTKVADYTSIMNKSTMFISHTPCTPCKLYMEGVNEWEVVTDFMKFDDGKVDLTTVKPDVILALANMSEESREMYSKLILEDYIPIKALVQENEVFSYVAKKYKKDNWKVVDDPSRYVKALLRHLLLGYLNGERYDEESGLSHLAHVKTNISFLMELNYVPPTTEVSNRGFK